MSSPPASARSGEHSTLPFDLTEKDFISVKNLLADEATIRIIAKCLPAAKSITRLSLYNADASLGGLQRLGQAVLSSAVKQLSIEWNVCSQPENEEINANEV